MNLRVFIIVSISQVIGLCQDRIQNDLNLWVGR